MRFEPRNVRLKNGAVCTLRPAVPEDAEQMIAYMKQTAAETEYVLRYPDEVRFTLEQEQDILERLMDDPQAVMMAAIVDGQLAGNSSIGGLGPKRKVRHRCSLAIALKREYWGQGIGTAMIGYLTELAGQMGFAQIDLEVVADNARAIALYEKCGFTMTGRRVRALRFDDGSWHDELIMVKLLTKEQEGANETL